MGKRHVVRCNGQIINWVMKMSKDKKDDVVVGADGQEDRRDLLKKLSAGGSGLAMAKWTAPIISAIAVPAHAQTSFTNSLVAIAP